MANFIQTKMIIFYQIFHMTFKKFKKKDEEKR